MRHRDRDNTGTLGGAVVGRQADTRRRTVEPPTGRARNPVPEPDSRENGYSRTAPLVLATQLRWASAARELSSFGFVGGAWK